MEKVKVGNLYATRYFGHWYFGTVFLDCPGKAEQLPSVAAGSRVCRLC